MKLKNRRITVSVSKKYNLGNYESMQLHAGLSADISDEEDLLEAYQELWDECNGQVLGIENGANKKQIESDPY